MLKDLADLVLLAEVPVWKKSNRTIILPQFSGRFFCSKFFFSVPENIIVK